MQKKKIEKKLVVHTKMKSKYAHFGPFLRIFLRTFLRQRAGTLEKVVKYDKEAFDKAWAWMASSPSDDEEE